MPLAWTVSIYSGEKVYTPYIGWTAIWKQTRPVENIPNMCCTVKLLAYKCKKKTAQHISWGTVGYRQCILNLFLRWSKKKKRIQASKRACIKTVKKKIETTFKCPLCRFDNQQTTSQWILIIVLISLTCSFYNPPGRSYCVLQWHKCSLNTICYCCLYLAGLLGMVNIITINTI